MNEIPHEPHLECFERSAKRITDSLSSFANRSDDEFTQIRIAKNHKLLLQEIAEQCYCFQFFALEPMLEILSSVHNSPTLRAARMGIMIVE